MGGVPITDAYILQIIGSEGAEMTVDLDGTPSLDQLSQVVFEQPESEKKSHKAKPNGTNNKLPPTNARALSSLRVTIPVKTPYSPTTTAKGRPVAGGGVSKAKTPSPKAPVTAPKQ